MAQLIPTKQFVPTSPGSTHRKAVNSLNNLMILMGIPVDNLTMDEALDRIQKMVLTGRQTETTHQVATVNVDFLVKAVEDAELRNLLQNADLCTADGMPLVWSSRMMGAPLKERVAGSDMVPGLAERAAQTGMSMYFMGGSDGSAETAKAILEERHPGLQIVGTSSPWWTPGQAFDQDVLDHIRETDPDILLVALGNPKQELWIQAYGEEVGVPVMIGIGASLDFIAGNVKRAPVWMQKSGLEWSMRLIQEPRRLWKRYAVDAVKFGPWMLQQWWSHRRNGEEVEAPLTVTANSISDLIIINLTGELDHRNCKGVLEAVKQVMLKGSNVTLNFAEVETMDAASLGTLIEVKKLVESNRGQLRMVGLSKMVASSLSMARLFNYFGITEHNMVLGYPN